MRTMIAWPAAALVLFSAAPVAAQTGDATVGSYLCQFANKCDPAASPAPPTETAVPTSSPRVRTSQTRGFHVAGGAYSAAPPAPVAVAPVRRARVAAARPAPVAGAGRRVNLLLSFDYNSDRMTPAAQVKAKVFAQALVTPELRDKRFLIEGHTDARGSRSLNVDLSRRRAKSVADFLIAQGVDAHNLDVRGVGSDVPLPGQPANAESNRRVEAVLIS